MMGVGVGGQCSKVEKEQKVTKEATLNVEQAALNSSSSEDTTTFVVC